MKHNFIRTPAIVLFVLSVQITLLCSGAAAQPRVKKIHRVLFLGNSITYAGNYITDIETYFVLRYPKQHIEFINVGLPSETVSGLSEPGHAGGRFPRPDLHERLARVLAQIKPDLIFACYGMNDGIYMPFDEGRFQKFKDGINWMHQELLNTGAFVVHVTPPVFDELKGGTPGYAEVLDRYADWLLKCRDSLKWNVADVHFPMKKYLEDHRATDPAFYFARDGVHPDSVGHWVMAKQFLLYLDKKKARKTESVADIYAHKNNGQQLYNLIAKRQAIMKDAWLTSTGHKRPGMNKGLPMDEAENIYKQIGVQIDELNK